MIIAGKFEANVFEMRRVYGNVFSQIQERQALRKLKHIPIWKCDGYSGRYDSKDEPA